MPKIFISYRRSDSRKDAGRMYDRLVEAFGKDNIFKDVDSINVGDDFRGALREAVALCDVELVIIGKTWLTVTDEKTGGRRLDNFGDFVRIEVESGLQRSRCRVIPVLVDNVLMPDADALPLALRELAFKNAATVRDDPDFHKDVDKLIASLGGANAPTPKAPTGFDVYAAISRFFALFEERQWEDARGVLAEIRVSGKVPRTFDVDGHEADVWAALDAEERDREYGVLRQMAGQPNTRRIWEALQVFWQSYPGYDPDNLARFQPPPPPSPAVKPVQSAPIPKAKPKPPATQALPVQQPAPIAIPKKPTFLLPEPFAWVDIPARNRLLQKSMPAFRIAKYPTTNAQYRVFLEAGGYRQRKWWTNDGWAVREAEKWQEPRFWQDVNFNSDEQPVVGVSWYEAVAYCLWLSEAMGKQIMLPSEDQWQYAAQGDDKRTYPWGNAWDGTRCNNSLDGDRVGKTTPVRQYEGKGDSPFGVVDMAGNVWEWCRTDYQTKNNDITNYSEYRVLRGGSWYFNSTDNFRCDDRIRLAPHYGVDDRGFRFVLS